jgi:imidazolonepropionase-like amidohydrolase
MKVVRTAALHTGLLICVHSRSFAAHIDLLIRNVTIVDVATGTATPKRSILIHDNRITAVSSVVRAPKQTQLVDGSGKFAIPGLWDMHVHLWERSQLPLYPAYGITGVRDMGSDYDRVKLWRSEMEKGRLIGPHIETCGPPIDGVPSDDPRMPVRVVRNPTEARSTFDQLDDENVDFIGVLPRLPRDAYFALAERARKYYSLVAGDVPASLSALEAVEARQKSIEHMSGILLACSSDEKRLRKPYTEALERGDANALQEVLAAAIETFSEKKAGHLFQRMALFETRSVPTLTKLRMSPGTRDVYEKLTKLLIEMHRAGVEILAGADSGSPGESLHEELELLVAAGMTPAQALRSATLEPAKYLDAAESLGAIEAGRMADLILLDGDPLADIRNSRKIVAVVQGGKYLSRARLKELRAAPHR